MSKGRYLKKKKTSPIWIILAVAAALVIAALVYFGIGNTTNPNAEQPDATVAADSQEQIQEQINEQIQELQNDTTPHNTESAEQITPSAEPEQNQQTIPQPTVVIVQRAEAEYEKWLAAAQIVCLSMEYPDFQLEGVYAASATSMEDKFSSDGAYIIFTSGGNRIAIHSKALDSERAAAGTIDISTEAIGYASFDKVDASSIDVSAMEELALEDLSELISQSLLVSIYTH